MGLLPLHYREAMQAMIYRHLPREIAQPWPDGAYWLGDRPMKLFVFSQLHGEVRYRPGEGVEVMGPVWFCFASPERDLALGLAAGLLGFGRVRIATLEFAVREIATLALPPLKERLVVWAFSPITMYRTLEIEGEASHAVLQPAERGAWRAGGGEPAAEGAGAGVGERRGWCSTDPAAGGSSPRETTGAVQRDLD